MTYVEGFVTPIPTDAKDAFTDHARRAATLMRELGAQRVVDAWGDDVPAGKVNDFAGAVQLKDGETVGFGWMAFADKAERDGFMQKMMSDPRMEALGDMPFDGKRMIFGGFRVMIDEGDGTAGGYVDGFVLPVAHANEQAYLDMATKACAVFREHGATRYVEAWGDDVPAGERTDFIRAVHGKADEAVVFSWCEWPDRATRDAGMKAVMEDERITQMADPMPFDGQRLIYGGFSIVNDA